MILVRVSWEKASRQFFRNVLVEYFLHGQGDDDRRTAMRTRPGMVADLSAKFMALDAGHILSSISHESDKPFDAKNVGGKTE